MSDTPTDNDTNIEDTNQQKATEKSSLPLSENIPLAESDDAESAENQLTGGSSDIETLIDDTPETSNIPEHLGTDPVPAATIPAQPSGGQEPSQPYYSYEESQQRQQQPPSSKGGCGCWVVGLVTGFIVASLIIVGLLLPPINLIDKLFGETYTVFSDKGNAAPAEGFMLSVDPNDIGTEFGVALNEISSSDFLNNSVEGEDWVPAAQAALPPYLALKSHVYTIDTTGSAPEQVMFTIDLPPNTTNPYTLDMYTWSEGDSAWQFVPSHHTADNNGKQMQFARLNYVPEHIALFQAAPTDLVIATTLEIGQTVSSESSSVTTIVSPTGMQPSLPTTPQRTLVGNPAAGFDLTSGYRVMPVVRNYGDPRATDVDTVVALIGNRELRDEHIQQLTAFTSAGGYSGIFIDYRDIPAEQRANFSSFIRELADSLHIYHLTLGVVVPEATITPEDTWNTGAYDWRLLSDVADYVQVNLTNNPKSYIDDGFVEAMLRWAVGEVNRYKILTDFSALSVREIDGSFAPVPYTLALAPLGNVQLSTGEAVLNPGDIIEPGSNFYAELDGSDALPGVDTTIQAPFINYLAEDGTAASTMWLMTSEALQFRLEQLLPFGIGGIAFPDLLDEGVVDELFGTLLNYRLHLPDTPIRTELALNWRIENADAQIAEFTTGFNEEIVVTIDAPDGNYAVNVDVIGGNISSARSGAPVAVFAPTVTPTPLPTNTPLPTSTPTPTPIPIVPTVPPTAAPGNPSGSGANTVPIAPILPPGGSIAVGSFEYGGHVTSTGSQPAINAMNQSGMTWMKVQIVYGSGMGTGDVAQAIGMGHAAGFKVLLGIVGQKSELQAGGGGYIEQFAGFLGDVAALGPDAIEVWNEPNLDREWPTNQISGGNYTALLSRAYAEIKARNPGVMVISAALAPTGAENAFPGQVVNDDNFLQQMVNSGALQYMDCLGMHYNEGIVPPRNTSGDPRDNYYTRYLPTMLDRYWSISSGQRPICITELGYLSPEGYGGLPAYFAWAANTTVAQHAAWLADAAAYTSQSGRVGLMIVWNIDFTHYDSNDPMAGYAIIRPNGDCPACRAFAGAR
jgi:hypothetical protein